MKRVRAQQSGPFYRFPQNLRSILRNTLKHYTQRIQASSFRCRDAEDQTETGSIFYSVYNYINIIWLDRAVCLANPHCCTAVYRPTAIIHGIMFKPTDRMEFLKKAIEDSQPGSQVDVFELWFGVESFLPMWRQVSGFYGSLLDFISRNPGPINLIGYSQGKFFNMFIKCLQFDLVLLSLSSGGLIARGVLNVMPNHTVKRFISLASPQHGFHGDFFVPKSIFSVGNEEKYSIIWYIMTGKVLLVVFGKTQEIWVDIKKKDVFLHRTMCKLEELVLIGGPDDGFKCMTFLRQFGYDDVRGRVTNMEQQPVIFEQSQKF
uniref:Uncharacterized protein n=1 Tax=Strigamia maritima TaxID=126957 RepID=T1J9W7_STRMM